MDKHKEQVYRRAFNRFGKSSQVLMAIQEMAELTKDLTNQEMQRWDKVIDIPGEIADVEIMMEQLKLMHGLGGAVEMIKSKKIGRLERILDELDKKDTEVEINPDEITQHGVV